MKETRTKHWSDLVSALLPLGIILVVAAEHYGLVDRWRGLDEVQKVSDRFDESYAPDASRPLFRGDAAWKPTVELIRKYSKVKLRTDEQPDEIVRFRATFSAKDTEGFEWTSPSTPFAVVYGYWPPETGHPPPPLQDVTIVGTIGELQGWIAQSESDFHFLVNDVILGLMPVLFGLWLWRTNYLIGNRE